MKTAYFQYQPCIVGITGENAQGDPQIGTGFHIGDGLIITARHVVEGAQDLQLANKFSNDISIREICYPESDLVDVAILKTNFDLSWYVAKYHNHEADRTKIDYLELGVEWDDFTGDSLVLSDAIVMGYSLIPTGFPTLVTLRAQINAVVDQYPVGGTSPPPFYVLSGIPRGEFSGAPMFIDLGERRFVMGVITSSFVRDQNPVETGFMAAVSIGSVLATLHRNRLYPRGNALAVKAFASELSPDEEKEFFFPS